MKLELIPISWPRVGILAGLFFLPAIIALNAGVGKPPGSLGFWVHYAVVALCFALAGAVAGTFAARRSIRLTDDALAIQHSFYTLRLERHEAAGAQISKLHRPRDLKLSLKKNGVAFHGLYSGWFYGAKGELVFCAVSRYPAYEIRLVDGHRCRAVVLSASDSMIEAIRGWTAR